MDIEICEVATKRALKDFVRFPLELYRNHPCHVPDLIADELHTLSRDRNPAFEFCRARYWLARADGRVVGRIAGIINERFSQRWNKPWLRFGWIDFVDDRAVSAALLATVEGWARAEGLEAVHGPMGFTDLDNEGMLVQGFDELGTLPMIYNHAYYPEHLEALGYRKDTDWLEFQVKIPPEIPERVLRVQRAVLQRTHLRTLGFERARDLRPYTRGLFGVLNEAYADLYGVVELSERQIDDYTNRYFKFVNPHYTKLVIDESDRVVGFALAMPSFSRALQKAKGRLFPFGFLHLLKALKWPRTIDFYLIGVLPKYQNKGVQALLVAELCRAAIEHGIESAETSGELEDNKRVQAIWKDFEVRQHKRRRVYVKRLKDRAPAPRESPEPAL